MNNTQGKATNKLMPHLWSVDIVSTAFAPLATIVLIPVTIPVIGKTSRKL
jgi:hypothetical protein